jgi:transcriptional regulator of nitric oxide reductase
MALALLLWCAALVAVPALSRAQDAPSLALARDVFPGAEGVGAYAGEPPAADVMIGGRLAGYLLSTRAVLGSVGYSGRPFEAVLGLDLEGRITGARLVSHNEPVLVIGVEPAELDAFMGQFRGLPVDATTHLRGSTGEAGVDAISRATVSSVLFADAILRAARAVALSRGIIEPEAATAGLDLDRFEELEWPALSDTGLVSRLLLTNGDIARALLERGRPPPAGPGFEDPTATFVDLRVALATPAMTGQNLLGEARHLALVHALQPGDQAIIVLASGRYSVKGTGFVRSGVFDRLQVLQGEKVIRLEAEGHTRIDELVIDGAPEFREMGWFVLPAASGFDPLQPWSLRLIVAQPTEAGEVLLDFVLPVTAPTALVARPVEAKPRGWLAGLLDAALEPDGSLVVSPGLWLEVWAARSLDIALLVLMLAVLSVALVFQDALVKRIGFYRRFRVAFLAVTLLWLGFAMGAQLSVVNILTFFNSLLTGFSWQVFLMEPLIFILWCYVALALLFLGRGVFCGWLCPFGALQELTNKLARLLRVPQLALPFGLHEKLWPTKYIVFLGLLALSLHAMSAATLAAEVEPFKTAIILRFVRDWPFVVYALLLLGAGLFIERFFCRYVCPLGAALAVPARLATFRWLKRRPQCGRECRICEVNCPVQAIHPSGEIVPNECIYCLDCQEHYHDAHTCPPLIKSRKRREAAAALHAPAGGGSPT